MSEGYASRTTHPASSDRPSLSRRDLLLRAGAVRAGAERVLGMNFAPLPLHVHSSMRMGADQSNSVLDPFCEARWVQRLFVGDNSALANALGGPNPTLTNQALCTRTAERIFAKYFGGEPWVGSEAPVSSLDDRVTARVLAGEAD
jgi:choline dehydrogenase-like flavoprotein